MKIQIIDLFKGILIGISNIVPGLSGGTIAVVLNIYDKLIYAIKDLFQHPIHSIKKIWGLLIGIVIGIVIAVFLVLELITLFPIPTMMLFVGFIIGSIPKIYQNTCSKKRVIIDYFLFIAMIIVLIIIIGLDRYLPSRDFDLQTNFGAFVLMFVVGVIIAATMIIPGISGSMILFVIGLYIYVNSTIKSFITEVFSFNFNDILTHALPLIPLAIGIIVGMVLVSKIIAKLLVKYRCSVYAAILGLLIASPFVVIYSMVKEYSDIMGENLVLNIIIGVFTLIVGAVCSLFLITKGDKNEQMRDI